MNTYLTQQEITELKAIRGQYFNENQLSDLITFLKKNGNDISLDNRENIDNVWAVIYDNLSGNILKHPEYVKCKENSPNILYGSEKNEKTAAINMYLKELNPKYYEVLQTASRLQFKELIGQVTKITANIKSGNQDFDSTDFILNKDFDFSPYTVDNYDKKQIDNTIAIDKAVSSLFDFITQDLNAEQKAIMSKNLLQTVTYFMVNSSQAVIAEKGNDFKRLVIYTQNQAIQ